MAQRNANVWSRIASRLTATAHTQASVIRWGVVILLTLIWIVGGMSYWLAHDQDIAQSIYLTLSAVGMWDLYFDEDPNTPGVQLEPMLQLVRFAAIAAPAVSLLFAFSGQLGRSLARIFNLGAAHHVVIAGDSPAALSLAQDCRRYKDSVILLASELAAETALGLRRKGVTVLEGDASHIETLRSARADHAAHVIAFEADDTANLQIEAAVRRLVGERKRRPPIGVHVATRSAMLLKEAREMRSAQTRTKKHGAAPPIDPKPFSLEEIAARALVQSEAQTLLSLAAHLNQDRIHIVFFGFCPAGEAVAERIFMSLWSAKFQPPRITVLTPDPEVAEGGFRARHREAFAHPAVWSADIAFLPFDWDMAAISGELLDTIEQARGKPTGIVVSAGSDPANIHLAISLKRACNHRLRWPFPIYMRESSQSEFSQQYARGDDTDELDAYLLAFGAHQANATRARVINGALDRGAAAAHEHYNLGLGSKNSMTMRELQAAMKDWADVLETYRAANRAVADAAMTKMWDGGWRPAKKGEKGDTAPEMPAEMMDQLARTEHDRWMAERLMSGWRPTGPGEERSNDLMAHNKLVPWDQLNEDDRKNDIVQVRAAVDVARIMHKDGFVRR